VTLLFSYGRIASVCSKIARLSSSLIVMVHGVHYPSQTLDEPSASFSHESFKEEPEEMVFIRITIASNKLQ
jgi:hypothetical protein